jgi:hypothetical protein
LAGLPGLRLGFSTGTSTFFSAGFRPGLPAGGLRSFAIFPTSFTAAEMSDVSCKSAKYRSFSPSALPSLTDNSGVMGSPLLITALIFAAGIPAVSDNFSTVAPNFLSAAATTTPGDFFDTLAILHDLLNNYIGNYYKAWKKNKQEGKMAQVPFNYRQLMFIRYLKKEKLWQQCRQIICFQPCKHICQFFPEKAPDKKVCI